MQASLQQAALGWFRRANQCSDGKQEDAYFSKLVDIVYSDSLYSPTSQQVLLSII